MDESAVGGDRGRVWQVARSADAVATLTSLPPGASLSDHVHDHPYLSLHVLGAYGEASDAGEIWMDGPGAAFHPAGSAHADRIGGRGLTTVIVEFDAGWLSRALGPQTAPERSTYWLGGGVAAGSARLARLCLGPQAAARSVPAALDFLRRALAAGESPPPPPPWMDRLEALLASDADPAPSKVGRSLGVSDAWLARAYRLRRGEGLAERRRRRRVETAVTLLETAELSLAEVALEAGFCDQSHMNRAFNLLLGRTPAQVRRERAGPA